MDLNKLLSQLGTGKKDTIYLSVSPRAGLEIIEIDTQSRTVKNYAYRPLEYNESLRQIDNMENFKNAFSELLEELNINPKCNVILNLPMVIFGSKELPLLLADDAITEALTSEVEQSYIFRRFEPMIRWSDSSIVQSGDVRKLFYTAFQKNMIDDITSILESFGAKLVSVQMSLTSLLKALSFSGLTKEQMKDNVTWNLMVIKPNGYSICSMIGKNFVDYYEEPLAINSFEGDEIYNAILSSAQITLMSYPANYLYIVSETDLVSAELLAGRISPSAKYFENNDFKKQNAVPVSLEVLEESAHQISLEAIGLASGVKLPVQFEFMEGSDSLIEDPNEPVHVVLGSKEFDISPNGARNIVSLCSAIILVPLLILALIVPLTAKEKQKQLDDITTKLSSVENVVKAKQVQQNKETFDANNEIKKILTDNRTKLLSYSALGESVPKKLWLTYFSVKDDGKIDIKGQSANVGDIYAFFRNMKDSLINTQLRIHKLEMVSKNIDDAVSVDLNDLAAYSFEITNMSDAEINPAEDSSENADNPDKQNAGSSENSAPERSPANLPKASDE